nr:hydrogenase [Desulfobulbaceae bacterium]
MDTFFLSLALILFGTTVSVLFNRQFIFMKAATILAITLGSAVGLTSVFSFLYQTETVQIVSWPWLHIFTLSFKMDSVAAFFLVPIFIISPLAAFYSFHYLENTAESVKSAVNYLFYAVLVVSMALVACSNNIPTFALSWEIMSLSSFFLVIYDYKSKPTRKAGYMYFIFAQLGAMFIFAAFALVYTHSGSFAFEAFSQIPEEIKLIVFILAFIGFGSKAGIFPLHIWLPHAHPAAPSHISAVMSGVMIKMGIYGIIRTYALLGTPSLAFGQIVLVTGMVTGVLGVVYALGKQDMKKLLAYSSVENIGIILIGLGIGMMGVAVEKPAMAFFGFAGAFMHVFNHSIFKTLLFMGAGAVLHKTHTRSINHLGGLIKRMPTTGKTFLVGSIAISGLPPFSGFIGEFLIYYGAFQGVHLTKENFILSVLAIVSLAVIGGFATACFTKVMGLGFLGEPRTEAAAKATEAGLSMRLTMIVLALACLLIGVLPEPFVRLSFMGIRDLKIAGDFSPEIFVVLINNIAKGAILFIAIFVVISLLRKMLYMKKEIGAGPTWGCGFTKPTVRMQYTGTSYAASMIDFYRPFVPLISKYTGINKIFPGKTTYETQVTDIAELYIQSWITKPLYRLLQKLRWIQHGNIQLYIGYIILTIVALLLFL